MTHYEKLFEPFTKDGSTLKGSIQWLKKTTGANSKVTDLVIADTIGKLQAGEKFALPCPCGCGIENVHTPINHYMLSRTYEIKDTIDAQSLKVIQDIQDKLVESRQKTLSNFDKEYFVMIHGRWYQRLWKWLTKYDGVK